MNDRRYATLHNPTIQAVVHGMYRFSSEEEVLHQLETLKKHFITAKKQIDNPEHPSLILWIKGYEVSEDDSKKGVIGHFAVISCRKIDTRFTLTATKMLADAREHPQRGQVKRDNPNWGHPVLRSVRRGRRYPTLEAAQAELNLLHEQFPGVSIPNPGKLYIMIYSSKRPPRERMGKHILEIKAQEDGSFAIDCRENTTRSPKDRPKRNQDTSPAQGFFTARVALGKQRKRPVPRKPNETA